MQAEASPNQSLQPFKESVECKLVFSTKHPKSARQPTSQAPDSTHKSCKSAQQGLIASHCPFALPRQAPDQAFAAPHQAPASSHHPLQPLTQKLSNEAPDSSHKACESAQQGLIASHCPLALSMVAPSLLTRPLLLPNKRPPRPFTPCNHPPRDMASPAASHAAVHVDDPHAPPPHQQVHLGHTHLTMCSLNCLMSDSNA